MDTKIKEFRPGDTIRVTSKIIEEGKERSQIFEGVVLAMRGRAENKTFTVMKRATAGVLIERIFPLSSPLVSTAIKKQGRTRRAKLYYLRNQSAKKARKTTK